MKRLFTTLLMLCVIIASHAEDFCVDGIYYDVIYVTGHPVRLVRSDTSGQYYTGNITVPKTVTYNGEEHNVTEIYSHAFYNCSGVTSVVIGNNITKIWSYAFWECTGVSSITIGSGVTEIGSRAFDDCTGELTVNCVIPDEAFAYADFTKVNMQYNHKVTSIGNKAFYDCTKMTTVNLPARITSIGNSAFEGCISLKSFEIPYNTTSIGSKAFFACTSLESIVIPQNVTEIGANAFDYCTSLKEVTIGENVTTIGDYAFDDCNSITSINCKAMNPPYVYGETFNSVPTTAVLHVPAGTADTYRNTYGWNHFTNIVDDLTPTGITNIPAEVNSDSNNCHKTLKNGKIEIKKDGHRYNIIGQKY